MENINLLIPESAQCLAGAATCWHRKRFLSQEEESYTRELEWESLNCILEWMDWEGGWENFIFRSIDKVKGTKYLGTQQRVCPHDYAPDSILLDSFYLRIQYEVRRQFWSKRLATGHTTKYHCATFNASHRKKFNYVIAPPHLGHRVQSIATSQIFIFPGFLS